MGKDAQRNRCEEQRDTYIEKTVTGLFEATDRKKIPDNALLPHQLLTIANGFLATSSCGGTKAGVIGGLATEILYELMKTAR